MTGRASSVNRALLGNIRAYWLIASSLAARCSADSRNAASGISVNKLRDWSRKLFDDCSKWPSRPQSSLPHRASEHEERGKPSVLNETFGIPILRKSRTTPILQIHLPEEMNQMVGKIEADRIQRHAIIHSHKYFSGSFVPAFPPFSLIVHFGCQGRIGDVQVTEKRIDCLSQFSRAPLERSH